LEIQRLFASAMILVPIAVILMVIIPFAIFFLFLYFYKKYEKSWGIIAGASKEYLEKSE